MRVPLEPVRELGDGVPAELEGHSVLLLGERADGTPLQIRSRMRRELELRSKDEPFQLAGTMRAMILAFDAAVWLRGVDLEGAVPNAEGEIIVDDMHERALLDAFEANLDVSLKLFRDLDADAALDAHDLAAELAASP